MEVETLKKCTLLWREADFEVKMEKMKKHKIFGLLLEDLEVQMPKKSAPRCGMKHIFKSKRANTPRSKHFWKLRCAKNARQSTCRSQKLKNLTASEHYLKLKISEKCSTLLNIAQHCGVKLMSKSKCEKQTAFPATLGRGTAPHHTRQLQPQSESQSQPQPQK